MKPWASISWALVLGLGMAESGWGQSIITTVAGGGVGDGGPATQARLNWPFGVFVDAQGNLFIADGANDRIRKVTGVGSLPPITPSNPVLSLDSVAIYFDDIPFNRFPAVGDTSIRALTIANAGDLPLHLFSIAVEHPAFIVSPDSATLTAGDSLRLTVHYAPREVRLDTAALTLVSNDPKRPQLRLPVYAAALGSIGPHLETSATFYLGAVSPGDSATFHLPVKNSGNRPLTLTSTAVDEKTFAPEQDTLTIVPGERDSLTIIFSPEEPGQVEGTLSLHSDDPLQPLIQVTLIGAGKQPPGPVAESGDLDRNGQIDFADLFLFAEFFQAEERGKLIALATAYLGLPLASRLEPNYPNLFNATTTIRYQISNPGHVRLEIFNLAGQQIQTLVDAVQQPGQYQTTWDGTDQQGAEVSTGPYLARLQIGAFTQVRKMLLMQ